MLCSGRILTCSLAPAPHDSSWRLRISQRHHVVRWCAMGSGDADSFSASADAAAAGDSAEKNPASFCIIEGPETVQDFAKMELQEIQDNIKSRRNKIFLHMEEVRRLRIQQRIKSTEMGISNEEHANELPDFPSFIPFLPPLSAANLRLYYAYCFSLIGGIIIFGGLLSPALELKLGIGGTSYADFIRSMHLPMQLSQVDPIVASFVGGAVGVISALMVVEINNVKQQELKRCKYCLGTGYLACARCSGTGALVLVEPVATVNVGDQPLSPPKIERCSNCSGSGKVLIKASDMLSDHSPWESSGDTWSQVDPPQQRMFSTQQISEGDDPSALPSAGQILSSNRKVTTIPLPSGSYKRKVDTELQEVG